MLGPRVWVGLLIIGMFAGCVGSNETKGGSPESVAPTATVDANVGEGVIQGLVMDLEARPVAQAKVGVYQPDNLANGTSLELFSDESGKFLVEGLAFGEYVVAVQKVGYRPTDPRTVDVNETGPAVVEIALEQILPPQAHHKTVLYRLHVENAFCLLACFALYQGSSNWSDPVANNEEINGPLMSLVFEATWVPSQPVCTMGIGLGLYSPEDKAFWYHSPDRASGSNRLVVLRTGDADAMLSPERTEANGGTPIPTDGDWSANSYFWAPTPNLGTPVDPDCSAYQDYDVAWTSFWVQPGAADFSAFEGA